MFIKKKVAIIGATGYVGLDLTYMLSKHKKIDIKYLCAQSNIGKNISFFDSRIKKRLPKISNISKIKWDEINLVFLSLPSGKAQKIIKSKYNKYKNLIFIDLSADFRIHDPKEFKRWYGINHQAQSLIKKSIYSISEFVKDDIKNYRIISNPGCYPTSIQLPLMPLLKNKLIHRNNITIDSKSGYSGAGKNFKNKFKHRNLLNSAVAYSVNKHRHMSELDQEFKKRIKHNVRYTFNPHLIPTYRGIISSIYVEIKKNKNINSLRNNLLKYYKNSKFIKILNLNKEIGTGEVLNTNKCLISLCKTRYKNKIVIFSIIDNLVKGASGQAIQNMNLIFNFKENESLL